VHVSGFTSAPNETLQVWTLDGSGNWQPKGTVVTSRVPTYHCTNIPNVPYDEYRFDAVMYFVHGARTIRVTEVPTGNCVQPLDYACWNANPQLDPCARASKCLAKCAVNFTVSAR